MSADQLLAILSDGKLHSGESLGLQMGLSRAAIWKQVAKLQEMGLALVAVRGSGYKLPESVDLLSCAKIRHSLSNNVAEIIGDLDVFLSIGSTNDHCLQRIAAGNCVPYVCFAEHQTSGRGRRGRKWLSPLGANLYMSVIWPFSGGASAIDGLSLAVGAVIADELFGSLGVKGISVKWPNDILYDGKKLGGILIEIAGDLVGPCQVVIGIGINVSMSNREVAEIDQPWIDVRGITNKSISRNFLAASLLERLVELLRSFENVGFSGYKDLWVKHDGLVGRDIFVQQGFDRMIPGRYLGVSDAGDLLIMESGIRRSFRSGEVSLRVK